MKIFDLEYLDDAQAETESIVGGESQSSSSVPSSIFLGGSSEQFSIAIIGATDNITVGKGQSVSRLDGTIGNFRVEFFSNEETFTLPPGTPITVSLSF